MTKVKNMEERRQNSHLERAHDSDPAATGLQLVERTAELIRATEDHATELVARSAATVSHLQEEMRLAERVLEAAETRRRVAEAELKNLKVEFEDMAKSYQDRIDTLNEDIIALRLRAERAEERAAEAEHALSRIQVAMQGILKVRSDDPGQPQGF
jgi:hypothetical protein